MKPQNSLKIGALLVILLTNAVALGGAFWNRSGEAESRLTLSQRELRMPYARFDRENSGFALALNWRVAFRSDRKEAYWDYSGGGAPEWLDLAKMESLGFDMSPKADDSIRWNDRALSKEVLLVLEMDGDAYRQSLAWAKQHLDAEEAKQAAMPESNEKKNRLKHAAEQLAREEKENSRLFVIDAGLDRAALRAKYHDRARYAIVRGQVRPVWNNRPNDKGALGYISGVSIAGINVPHAIRPLFASASGQEKFTAAVAFGRRLEPWIDRLDVATR